MTRSSSRCDQLLIIAAPVGADAHIRPKPEKDFLRRVDAGIDPYK